MRIEPLRNYVLVKINKTEQKEIIIEPVAEGLEQGLVMAIGPSVTRGIKVGDAILFGRYSGAVARVENAEAFLLMRDTDILAKLSS